MNLSWSDKSLFHGRYCGGGVRVSIAGLSTACIILHLIFLLFISLPSGLSAEEATFAVISDTHVGNIDSVYSSLIWLLRNEQINLIIHSGDAIRDPGDANQWKKFTGLPGRRQTIYVAAGNHDIEDQKSFEVFLQFFHEPYRSFSSGNAMFILLNTEVPGEKGRIAGKQLEWLKGELKKPFRYKFVFLHQPPLILTPRGAVVHDKAHENLHELFAQNGVSVVFSGHYHVYSRSTKDGVVYVTMPPGMRQWSQVLTGIDPGYMVATWTKGGFIFKLKDLRRKTRDEFLVVR
ncbi:MAG TPA: metallophosphoesterase [Syntrophorhabdaceae bacterium]|nr:metallophosphoesterase [Syntrophorhabdaceae bacterium]